MWFLQWQLEQSQNSEWFDTAIIISPAARFVWDDIKIGLEPSQTFLLMNTPSADQIGLTVIHLTAALSSQQWIALKQFAEKRLRRVTRSPLRQRLYALHCPRSLVHTAIEQFALGDVGLPGGRKLKPHQRSGPDTFVPAIQAVVNSLLSHMLEKSEIQNEHLPIGEAPGLNCHEPSEPSSLSAQLEAGDLQRELFNRLQADAGENPELQAAVRSLQDDCVTGHVMGTGGVTPEAKRQVRERARQKWEDLTL